MPDAEPMRRPYVLVDWDNTVRDAAGPNLPALQQVLAGYGLSVDAEAYGRAYTVDYRTLYRRLGLADELIDEASDRWRAIVAEVEPRLLPGADAALDRLAAAGRRLGLVTTASRRLVEPQLERLGLLGRFAATVFGDGQPPRPDPAPLAEALAGLGAKPEAAAFCSDTVADMRMARAAGVHAVGVATFVFDEDALHAAGADETARSLAAWADRELRQVAHSLASETKR